MFSVYQLTDALTASLFGMFALWAAASHRHWFVRTAVLGAALLIMLLIPAYEPLVEFSLEVLLVVCGIAVWRRRRASTASGAGDVEERAATRFRISLETLLLIMVVVAVVTAVAARAPHISIYEWYEYIYAGSGAGLVVLISTWVVCGRTRWWMRLIALPALIYLAALTMRWFVVSRWMLQYWLTAPSVVPQMWKNILDQGIFSGTSYWVGSIGLGAVNVCIWLFVVRQAGWFDPFRDSRQSEQQFERAGGWKILAHCTACGLFIAIGSYSLWLFYLLMTPALIPDFASGQLNCFRDLIKAGQMVGLYDDRVAQPSAKKTKTELQSTVSQHNDAFNLVHAALESGCHFPLVRPWGMGSERWDTDHRALAGLQVALWERESLASTIGWNAGDLETDLDLLRMAFAEDHSNGVDPNGYALFVPGESTIVNNLWHRRTKLDVRQCTELARKLWELESHRVDFETKLENERIIAENSGFEPHLRSILDHWAGINRFSDAKQNYLHVLHADADFNCGACAARLRTRRRSASQKPRPIVPEIPFEGSGRPVRSVSAFALSLARRGVYAVQRWAQ